MNEKIVIPPIPKDLQEEFLNLTKRLDNMRHVPFDLLDSIYRYLEKYNRFVATFSVCSKGCSACCHIPVNLSRFEAEYIARKTKTTLKISDFGLPKRSPCPFLSEIGSCSVYEYRPFNCRTFHTLDSPHFCLTDEDHAVYGVSSRGYGSDILFHFSKIIRHINGNEYKDIRHYFS